MYAEASGLFQDNYLALAYPTSPTTSPRKKWVIITGGALCGSLCHSDGAVAAGYAIASSLSQANFDKVEF